jgi:hypothetical protein
LAEKKKSAIKIPKQKMRTTNKTKEGEENQKMIVKKRMSVFTPLNF